MNMCADPVIPIGPVIPSDPVIPIGPVIPAKAGI